MGCAAARDPQGAHRRATISDVARRAGVSKGLVSFVVNDRPGVAEATRARILDAVRELDWRPRQAARSLTNERAYALGLVLARPPELLAADPFFSAFIAGIETEMSARSSALVLQVVPDLDAEMHAYRRLAADKRVDGVVLADLRVDDPRPRAVAELGLPAITLGRPDGPRHCPAVVLDDIVGIVDAVRLLADLGHRRIAFVGGPDIFLHARHRRAAWAATMAELGLPVERLDFGGDFGGHSGAAGMRRALALPPRQRPSAVLFANDLMAVAGVGEATRRGVAVPDDISVIGFDDIPVAAHMHPALTTVGQDAVGWGRAAARVLFDLAANGDHDDVELDPAHLTVRESTAAAPSAAGRASRSQQPTDKQGGPP